MKIEIRDNAAIGLLEFYPDAEITEETLAYIRYRLYNIEFCIWYNIEQNVVLVQMIGSIISMMQFRKIILMNYPNALKE